MQKNLEKNTEILCILKKKKRIKIEKKERKKKVLSKGKKTPQILTTEPPLSSRF